MGFKENLKEQLSFSGMYVKELAALSGVKKQTIDSYLREDSCTPLVETAVALARALGVSVEYLVTGKEKNQKNAQYPEEARLAAEITAKLDKKNRKLAIAILESIKKQEEKG